MQKKKLSSLDKLKYEKYPYTDIWIFIVPFYAIINH